MTSLFLGMAALFCTTQRAQGITTNRRASTRPFPRPSRPWRSPGSLYCGQLHRPYVHHRSLDRERQRHDRVVRGLRVGRFSFCVRRQLQHPSRGPVVRYRGCVGHRNRVPGGSVPVGNQGQLPRCRARRCALDNSIKGRDTEIITEIVGDHVRSSDLFCFTHAIASQTYASQFEVLSPVPHCLIRCLAQCKSCSARVGPRQDIVSIGRHGRQQKRQGHTLSNPEIVRWRWMRRILQFSLFEPLVIDPFLRGTWLLNAWLRLMGADVSMGSLILGRVSDYGVAKVWKKSDRASRGCR